MQAIADNPSATLSKLRIQGDHRLPLTFPANALPCRRRFRSRIPTILKCYTCPGGPRNTHALSAISQSQGTMLASIAADLATAAFSGECCSVCLCPRIAEAAILCTDLCGYTPYTGTVYRAKCSSFLDGIPHNFIARHVGSCHISRGRGRPPDKSVSLRPRAVMCLLLVPHSPVWYGGPSHCLIRQWLAYVINYIEQTGG